MCLSIRSVAKLCDVPERQIHRWLRADSGPLLWRADRIADHLGVHILEIWPGAYERMAA